MSNEALLEAAKQARKHAYAPYSHFLVGAALLTAEGKVYTGANIENASYGASNCAERTAVFKAVSEGERNFIKIAVAGPDGHFTSPCGICRQVIMEFMPNGSIILEDKEGNAKVYQAAELLPSAFAL